MFGSIFNRGWTLFRVAGIPITVNASWLPIGFLVVFGLWTALGSTGAALPVAVLVASAFFGSILLHELGHALAGRPFGVRTDAITLHFFGGVARLLNEPRTPLAEFVIAVAGPLVSLALAGLCGAAAFVLLAIGPGLFGEALLLIAQINLILGIFNLLPGLPLDGGRILRSIVWWRTRSRDRGTRAAARGGVMVGYGLIGLGVLGMLGYGPGGIATALIGLFIVQLARAEERSTNRPFFGGAPGSAAPGPNADMRFPGLVFIRQQRPEQDQQEPRTIDYIIRDDDGREEIGRIQKPR